MKAVVLKQAGGVEHLLIKEIEKPSVKDKEILVEVKAISINPVDYKVRKTEEGFMKMFEGQKHIILGWDIAGVVVSLGGAASQFEVGDRVFGMVNFPGVGNAYAEFVSAPESHFAKIPDSTSFNDAAATTLAALTALQVLQGRVKAGDRVLIHAGSGGVGHFAIQIANHLGAYVITTSSAKNREFVMSLGADEHVDYRAQAFEEHIKDVDFVFDTMGGDVLKNSVKVMADGGSIISIPSPEFSDELLAQAKSKNVSISNLLVGSNGDDMNTLKEYLEKGIIKPFVSDTFAFNEIGKAHLQLESGRTVGKVVVTL